MYEKMDAYDIKSIFRAENSCSIDVTPRRAQHLNTVPQQFDPTFEVSQIETIFCWKIDGSCIIFP
jgi:hypothetical protein